MNIVTLFEGLVNALFEAEEKFLKSPSDFHSLEKAVKSSTEAFPVIPKQQGFCHRNNGRENNSIFFLLKG